MSGESVVYLALGTRRVQAAVRLTAGAARAGADVLLVVPDSGAWRDLQRVPGVTVRRLPVPAAAGTVVARAARRFLLGPHGAPAGAVLVAGDAPAIPVVEAVGRRRPDLDVRTEPGGGPGRRPAPADLAVLTPWYPGPNDDFAGAYVRATVDAVRGEIGRISLLHTESWFYPEAEAGSVMVEPAAARIPAVTVMDTEQGELSRIAVPSVTSGDYPVWMDDHVRALRAALPTGRIEAPVVHAHTGVYGGVAAAALARPDARVVITEHATFLPRVLRRPAARRRYAAALDRADAVLCVGPGLRAYLAAEFPLHAGKLHVVPNPIDFDRFGMRDRPPEDLRRWLYVGRLVEHKGVRLLLDVFATVAATDPAPTLTLVGAGPLEAELRARAAGLGLGERVRLLPPVRPDRIAKLFCDFDLLVHLSTRETFGLTVVEAIATGTPVLVARSEGTQETMAGLHGRAGLLIDPAGDASTVAEAYHDLRQRLPQLDLPGAREELRARYGTDAVAARLRQFYTGGLEPPPTRIPEAHAERVIVITDGRSDVDRARPIVDRSLAAGLHVDLLTTVDDDDSLDRPGVTVHRLHVSGMSVVAELALRRVPGKGLALLLAAAQRRPGPALEAAVRRAQRAHRRTAGRIARRPWWTAARIRAVWSAIRREALPRLAPARTRAVVAPGAVGRGIADRLVTGHPGILVTRTLDEVPGLAVAASAHAPRR